MKIVICIVNLILSTYTKEVQATNISNAENPQMKTQSVEDYYDEAELTKSLSLLKAKYQSNQTETQTNAKEEKTGECEKWPAEKCRIEVYPYFVSIQDNQEHHLCGGSLLGNTTVITSGRCCLILLDTRSRGRVVAGMENIVKGQQFARILDVKIHEDFDQTSADLCVIRTLDFFVQTDFTKFVNLPNKDVTCKSGVMLGYGTYNARKKVKTFNLTEDLRCTAINLKDTIDCVLIGNNKNPDIVCGEVCGSVIDACYLDEGAPLICDDVLYGVVSRGNVCSKTKQLQPATQLGPYNEWITSNKNFQNFRFRAARSSSAKENTIVIIVLLILSLSIRM